MLCRHGVSGLINLRRFPSCNQLRTCRIHTNRGHLQNSYSSSSSKRLDNYGEDVSLYPTFLLPCSSGVERMNTMRLKMRYETVTKQFWLQWNYLYRNNLKCHFSNNNTTARIQTDMSVLLHTVNHGL